MPTAPRTLPGAAARTYNVASTWEKLAVLSEEQERVVDLVSQHCAERPLPKHVLDKVEPPTTAAAEGPLPETEAEPMAAEGSLEEAVLENSNQFYRWHSEVEAARVLETEEKHQEYAESLRGHIRALDELQEKVEGTLQLFEQLKGQHQDVASKSKALHDSCELLVAEKDRLVEFADALRDKLSYFDELDSLSAKFHSASLAVESEDFLPILRRLDECIAYVTMHPQFADSASYAGRFRQLQSRAMSTIRTKVNQILRHAADQVQAAIKEQPAASIGRGGGVGNGSADGASHPNPPSEGAETALLYVRFRATVEPGIKGLLQSLESRAQQPEYAQLMADCQRMYCEVRLQLMATLTEARIQQHRKEPLPTQTRNGWAALMQICQMEYQLFENLFPGRDPSSGALSPLIDTLADMLYETLRPAYIHLQDLAALCQLVDILQREILEEQLDRRGEAVALLRGVLQRTIADVQHRLTFRAQAFIKEVSGFQPKPDDLDYPQKLLAASTTGDGEIQADSDPADSRGALSPETAANGQASASGVTEKESGLESYKVWYPTVRETLSCLGKLYRCVEPRVFAGLAQDAVTACTASVQLASRAVAKKSGLMHGQLFLIKQLLILREQIAPFDADFSHVEKDLDFSHMRSHLRRILAGKASLFSLSANNAVVQLVSRGGPRILENQVDSKKELEKLLKVTCEAFIMSVTKASVEPLLSFITKVTAVRARSKHVTQNKVSGPQPPKTKPLREQAFAAPERLVEMVAKVRGALASDLPQAIKRMQLYLSNPATHKVLYRPIKSNIVEAHGQIQALLDSDYTGEEAAAIALPTPLELKNVLDGICPEEPAAS